LVSKDDADHTCQTRMLRREVQVTVRAARLALLLFFVAILAVTGYDLARTELRIRASTQSAERFLRAAHMLEASILELRATQQAYVAVGQTEDYWIDAADTMLQRIRADLQELQSLAFTPDAQEAVGAASSALDSFAQMDVRARQHTRAGQRLLASDLIFADGLELIRTALSELEEGRRMEAAAHQLQISAQKQRMIVVLGVTTLLAVVIVFAMSRLEGRAPEQRRVKAEVPQPHAGLAGAATQGSRSASTPTALPEMTPENAPAAAPPAGPVEPPQSLPDLRATADLCTDLGRTFDSSQLPHLLERAARVLDAAGIILWVGEPSEGRLHPALTHGYPARLVARMSSIQIDEENATAAAYRAARLQTVTSEGAASGALVAPLINASGCIGVMAAELKNGHESNEAVQAVASILAAQFATLVGAVAEPEARQRPETEARA
jgi:hypothetical protein